METSSENKENLDPNSLKPFKKSPQDKKKQTTQKTIDARNKNVIVVFKGCLKELQFFEDLFRNLLKLLSQLNIDVLDLTILNVEFGNSAKMEFSIPKDAALLLRKLTSQGSSSLVKIGILSVQVEGDQKIPLKIASRFGGETQELVLDSISSQEEDPAAASVSTLLSSVSCSETSTAANISPLYLSQTAVISATPGCSDLSGSSGILNPSEGMANSQLPCKQTQMAKTENSSSSEILCPKLYVLLRDFKDDRQFVTAQEFYTMYTLIKETVEKWPVGTSNQLNSGNSSTITHLRRGLNPNNNYEDEELGGTLKRQKM